MCHFFFFFKQKTAYEIYQCDWSSDVCSSDLFGDDLEIKIRKQLTHTQEQQLALAGQLLQSVLGKEK